MSDLPTEEHQLELERRVQISLDAEEIELPPPGLRRKLHIIIFGVDTWGGKAFDVGLLIAILLSVLAVMLESVPEIRAKWGAELYAIEWGLTILFTFEYLLRMICVIHPGKYAFSFFGIVDLLAILPSYLSIFFVGSHSLSVVRAIRLLRIFRVLKMVHYLKEANHLWVALQATRRKISVFLVVILTVVLIMGSTMYLVEGPEHGFTSIPKSVYWSIVTMTTVGYGDIAPQTTLGQTIAAIAMILGYCIIIVPTGVFSVEVVAAQQRKRMSISCGACHKSGHEEDAAFCKYCGSKLPSGKGAIIESSSFSG